MSLPKFVIGMIFVIAAVSLWSYLDSATAGTVVLRVIACAVILQVGYFLVVFAMVAASSPRPGEKARTRQVTGSRTAKADELTTKGT
jgi:exopolysaccharide production repressor protein